MSSLLAGQDTCVVMPTGGGKSLCYQMPAALFSTKTAIVVSPLIALMQDQARQLEECGIPVGLLNSTIPAEEQARVIASACAGDYRLLYLSPERLARSDTVEWLKRVPISFFAIDEAHCISEWGHEFRPEYRQLSRLRQQFPERPIAAFTASATRQVRHDIITQLQLIDPQKFIASFHRPNLSYLVKECDAHTQQALLLTALRRHQGSNVIVYAPTIQMVEAIVDLLARHEIQAIAYHGRMTADVRKRNQELWTSDKVRVLVGTVAFGLGINKAAVRAVIHLSLPKSVEQYYQEAGRAGRDGASADCLLLWRKRDAGLLAHFIGQVTDPAERERGWERYRRIRRFVESPRCRHLEICLHFGETPKWKTCGACDVCSGLPPWMQGTAAKIPLRRNRHRPTARPIQAEHAAAGVVDTSRKSERRPVAPRRSGGGSQQDDGEYAQRREYVRQWRQATARKSGIPAFIVIHDSTLDDLCRQRPASLAGLMQIAGIGERKAELYGTEILQVLKQFDLGARAEQPRKLARKKAKTKKTTALSEAAPQ